MQRTVHAGRGGALRRRAVLVALLVLASVGATLTVAAPAQADEPRGTRISRAEIIVRAYDWWQRRIPYNQGATATDVEGVPYRTDCSGFISMAWRLSTSRTTDTLDDVSTTIPKSDLQEGDIMMWDGSGTAGHVVLFEKWANADKTRLWIFEQASTAEDMNHREAALSEFSHMTAYKYGDGDGAADERNESFNQVAGTEVPNPGTSAPACNTRELPLFRLTGYRNVEMSYHSCIREESATTLTGWIAVSWRPYSGSDDDSTVTVGTKFDGFGIHPQLQVGDITKKEWECWVGGDINAAASGVRACSFSATRPSGGTVSVDGFLNWDENNDGLFAFGPHYVYGSPVL
ncbi:NlpC/P60 family protein [Micromonospora sp. URMC 103]|uniref:NlpC/P60 family protein n=1 Tax=Micromonospora sp. URMC 103 TaxID=3423406 RepID=UPI003F1DE1A1